jgi:two-component system, LuxR family, response regulator DctR
MTNMISCVYIVDDESAVRDSLSFMLRSRGIKILTFDSGYVLLDFLKLQPKPWRGVFLLDIRMEPISGLDPMVVDALKKGAYDFIEKPYSDNALADRIEGALKLEAAMQLSDAKVSENAARMSNLTDREKEVMHRVALGKLNKIIADDLGVSIRTIEVHRARVFSKLGIRSSAELATLLAK